MSFIRLDILIEEAGLERVPDLAHIHGQCFAHGWSEDVFRNFLNNKIHRILVASTATRPNEPVGFTLIRTVSSEAEILSVAVMEQHREEGIASGLIYRVCEALKSEGVKKLFLEVGRRNRAALALYEKLDFEPVGGRKAYYPGAGGESADDAIIMSRAL